jgi:divalent metal cation (Fe/Co/Zn/Cd) transporter
MAIEHRKRLQSGLILVGITMAYNAIEAVIALWTAYRDHSVSLEAFGLDSIIELSLAAVLLWRLTLEMRTSQADRIEAAERRSNWWAGFAFYALAAVIVLNTGFVLWHREASDASLLGIGMALASVIIMPVLARAKKRIGKAIGSTALEAEANCTWVCFYMSVTLLVGLVATRFLGWWWADPVAALGIVYWIINEGRESFQRASGTPCCGCS